MIIEATTKIWYDHLRDIIAFGTEEQPRGMPTLAVYDKQLTFYAAKPVVMSEARKLNYRFMMAEAYWILSGDNTVAGIAPWNSNISQFSDDGVTFWGAYGPRIRSQTGHVIKSLRQDRHTRQAVLTIWDPSPPKTKDVPCTLVATFRIDAANVLHQHVMMRSSDAWLGLPYDVFNFAMLQTWIAYETGCTLGKLTYTLVNAHLYEQHWDLASRIVTADSGTYFDDQPAINAGNLDFIELIRFLQDCRDQKSSKAALHAWMGLS